ncbi:MAG: TIGR00725 family protein [Desulfovibrionales bacterium]
MMQDRPRVAIVGAGQCDAGLAAQARQLGRLLAARGCVIVCGGLGGVMQAVCQGAREQGGLTIGLLPGLERSAANPHVDIPVATGLGHMRNYLVVLNSDIVCALGGGHGTLSEIALARKIGREVVAVGGWDEIDGVRSVRDVDAAAACIAARFSRS